MRTIVCALAIAIAGTMAYAHDSWISRGGHRNATGEGCCGEGDCFIVPADGSDAQVTVDPAGWFIL